MTLEIHRWQACEPALRTWALRLCGNRPDADDLVQDALERGLRHVGTLSADADPGPWLRGILRNRFVDLYRKRARRGMTVPLDELPLVDLSAEPSPAWTAISDDDVRAAVAALPDDLRIPYELRLAGRSYAHIGRACGIGSNTVGTRLLRARACLRQRLAPLLPRE